MARQFLMCKSGRFALFTRNRECPKSTRMMSYWCNGEWNESGAQTISVTDRGWLHGYGLFESLLAIDGRPAFADRHLDRIRNACGKLGWNWDHGDLTQVMRELLVRNQLTTCRARIRLALSGGSGELGLATPGGDRQLTLMASRLAEPDARKSVWLSPWTRNERSPIAGLKCASYAENLLALQQARHEGYDEAIFFNSAGWLCEAATANVFLVNGGRLFTPCLSSGCLPGVTRSVIIECARDMGVACLEQPVDRKELDLADEIFLTSSTSGVVAVTRLDQRTLETGPVTSRMRDAWNDAVRSNC